jgi:transcriptional regulator GlxA family with amidase domain
MDHHFRDGITVEALAGRLGVHRSTLFRQFHAEFGLRPKSYLDSLRLGLARELLSQSDSGLKQIASACGYNSLPHFVRCFHWATGRAPGAWRRGLARGPASDDETLGRGSL